MQFDLKLVPHKSIKGNVISRFLTNFSVDGSREEYEFPREDLLMAEDECWDLYFDRVSNQKGCDTGVLLVSPESEHTHLSVILDFDITNNTVNQYKAYIIGFQATLSLDIKKT